MTETTTRGGMGGESHGTAAESPRHGRSAGTARPNGGANGRESGGWSRWRRELAAVEPERYALVGGGAALGVMVGAAAARAMHG